MAFCSFDCLGYLREEAREPPRASGRSAVGSRRPGISSHSVRDTTIQYRRQYRLPQSSGPPLQQYSNQIIHMAGQRNQGKKDRHDTRHASGEVEGRRGPRHASGEHGRVPRQVITRTRNRADFGVQGKGLIGKMLINSLRKITRNQQDKVTRRFKAVLHT